MTYPRILLALNVSLLLAVPACNGQFSSLGNDNGGTGGANAGGASALGGANGSGGSSAACGPISMLMPVCSSGTAVMQYDTNGCGTGYACPDTACACTGTHPMIANQVCSDGSTGGPVCATSSDGTCSWIVRSCPAQGTGGTSGTGTGSSGSAGAGTGNGGATSGGSSTCGAVSMLMPVCNTGTATMQYDANGCATGYGCPSDVCTCTGPTLGVPNVMCSDGTMGGPVCAKQAATTCSWIVRSCP